MTPSVVRVLVVLLDRIGPIDIRQIAIRSGLSRKAVEKAVEFAEDALLLDVEHGTSRYTGDESKANSYRVTRDGRGVVPVALTSKATEYRHSLANPIWAERGGFGLRGLLLALTYEGQIVTTEQAADLWGCSTAAARKLLYGWAARTNGVVIRRDGQWIVSPIQIEDPTTEARFLKREEALAYERKAAERGTSVERIKMWEKHWARQHEQTKQAFEGWEL